MYLLDSNVVMSWLNGKEPARSLVVHLLRGPDRVCVNAITLAEVYSSLADTSRDDADRVMAAFEFWAIDEQVARDAGRRRWEYKRQGHQYNVPDMLMGAHALSLDAWIVTDDIRDFPMPGLRILRPGDPWP
jgi:predicted nucleic acid-binding protein